MNFYIIKLVKTNVVRFCMFFRAESFVWPANFVDYSRKKYTTKFIILQVEHLQKAAKKINVSHSYTLSRQKFRHRPTRHDSALKRCVDSQDNASVSRSQFKQMTLPPFQFINSLLCVI